jgi:hypothetical protein
MTELLKKLLHDYGLLSVSISAMDAARMKWSDALGRVMSDEELSELPIAKDEPVLMVRIAKGEEPSFLKPEEHGIQLTNKDTGEPVGDLTVLELAEDEFYFFKAFRGGIASLTNELPDFFYGMCLVHAHVLLEHYLSQLLKSVFLSRPEMLGKSKNLSYGDVLESYPSMDALLDKMAEKELRELFYKSWRDLLETLREKYGFKHLPNTRDEKTIELSLIRNCLVHNRGIVDLKLEEASKGTYKYGTQIQADMDIVHAAINNFSKLAAEIDNIAESQHLKKKEPSDAA